MMICENVQRTENAREVTNCSGQSAKTFSGLFLLMATQRITNFQELTY